MNELTHFNMQGEAQMIDVTQKSVSVRVARAGGKILMKPDTLDLITSNKARKGDVLGTARLAGIMASKQTASLIPLCHPIPINSVSMEFTPVKNPSSIEIVATVTSTGQTGVEMEALTATSVAALTIYDMVKSVDRGMIIVDVRLLYKEGGKSGRYEAT